MVFFLLLLLLLILLHSFPCPADSFCQSPPLQGTPLLFVVCLLCVGVGWGWRCHATAQCSARSQLPRVTFSPQPWDPLGCLDPQQEPLSPLPSRPMSSVSPPQPPKTNTSFSCFLGSFSSFMTYTHTPRSRYKNQMEGVPMRENKAFVFLNLSYFT
jgi:hypothetical protein